MGAMIRSRADWTFLGEKPTKYYLNLEKKKSVSKTLYRIKNEKGEIVEDPKLVLDVIKKYYSKLYSTTGRINK